MSESSFSRRKFLEWSATWGLAALGLGGCRGKDAGPSTPPLTPDTASVPGPPEEAESPSPAAGRSQVVLVRNAQAVPGEGIDRQAVAQMLERGLLALTGEKSVEAAWRTLIQPEDVVGLKINCLFSRASTHPEVTTAVVESLQQAGVPAENLLIWDRNDGDLRQSGYSINRSRTGVRCYGTNNDYEPRATIHGRFNGRLSRILTEQITALVNVPILKDHGIAGVTGAMKNHYGSFHNPNAHHDNNCDPYIADLNCLPAIREKTRLIICDALRPIAHGGPRFRPDYVWPYGGLLLSTDPVAVDTWGWRIIEERRKETGLRTLEQEGRPPRQLASAAARGLGVNDPDRIDLIEV